MLSLIKTKRVKFSVSVIYKQVVNNLRQLRDLMAIFNEITNNNS